MAIPSARAAIRTSSRWAAAGSGVGRVEDLRRQDPLGQVVAALEVDPARGDDLAGEEQVLERELSLVPVPHVAGSRRRAHRPGIAGADRTLLADQLARGGHQLGLLAGDPRRSIPTPRGARRPSASAAADAVDERDQRGLVRPVLDQPPVDAAAADARRSGPGARESYGPRRENTGM